VSTTADRREARRPPRRQGDEQGGHLALGVEHEDAASRVSLLAKDTTRGSDGAPISWSARWGAIELEPGAKYSVRTARLS
jgi:hypothetical protein